MQALKENNRERAMEFFMSKLHEMDAQTQSDIKTGRKELHMADFYIRKKLSSGTGIVKLIVETDTLAPGVTNIDKGKLYPGNHLVVTAIGLAYAYNASTTTVDTQDYSSNIYKINDVAPDDTMVKSDTASAAYQGVGVAVRYIPVGIVNSEFTMTAGGKLIFRSRAKKFFAESQNGFGAEANDENAVLLTVPKLVLAEKLLGAQFEFGANAATLSNNHFIELRLQGVYVADKA